MKASLEVEETQLIFTRYGKIEILIPAFVFLTKPFMSAWMSLATLAFSHFEPAHEMPLAIKEDHFSTF